MAEGTTQVRCPHCKKNADADKVPGEGDIICMQCGMNLLTGHRIEQSGGAPQPVQESGSSSNLVWVLIPSLLLGLGLILMLVFFLNRDPVEEARRLAATNNIIEAKAELESYLPSNPDDVEAQLLYGKLECQSGNFPRALDAFEIALENDPGNLDAADLALYAASNLGGDGNTGRKLNTYRRVVDLQPDHYMARQLLGATQGANQNFGALVENLDAVMASTGEDPALLTLQGAAHALQGDPAAARSAFLSAEAVDPNDPFVALAKGVVASLDGDTGAAQSALSNVSGAGPQVQALVDLRLGMLRMGEGNFGAALPLLRNAMEVDRAKEEAEFFHAVCLKEENLQQEALSELQRIAESQNPFAGKAALEAALMYMERGDLDNADAMMRYATSAVENSAKLYTIQGQVFAARGNFTEAQQSYRRAIQTDPNYAAAHLENGLLYVQREVIDQGMRSLEQYLALAADQPGANTVEVELLLQQLEETTRTGNPAIAAR